MKKAFTILAIAATAATMTMADVASKNVVGYHSVDLPVGKYVSIGWQFAQVLGASNVPINSAYFTNYLNPRVATSFTAADDIRRYDSVNSAWVDYFRRYAHEWRKVGETGPTTDKVNAGEMILFMKKTTASTLHEQGEVIVDNISISVPVGKYVAMCNPYPVELLINSPTLTNYPNPRVATSFTAADDIRRYDTTSSAWVDYFRRYAHEWRKVGESVATTDKMGVGEGFLFMKKTTASSISFTSPL